MNDKILVVDDTALMRIMYKNALAVGKYTNVIEAENGEDACRIYDEELPDIVIMDISMPKKSGLEAMRDIIKKHPNAKVIICSASGQREIVVEAVKLGAADFILKPLNPERLLKAVDNILSSRK